MQSLGKKPIVDLTGKVFDFLTVIGPASERKSGIPTWDCKCQCGVMLPVTGKMLRKKHTRSCGCLRAITIAAVCTTHGATRKGQYTAEYHIYYAMLARCKNPDNKNWKDYGGRGISVCERWQGEHGYENFLADKGVRPSPQHSIDRWPNNDGNYEPDNTRWATKKEQVDNRRCTRK
jgi:hypothetical protein